VRTIALLVGPKHGLSTDKTRSNRVIPCCAGPTKFGATDAIATQPASDPTRDESNRALRSQKIRRGYCQQARTIALANAMRSG
jgi:hypothetical protein